MASESAGIASIAVVSERRAGTSSASAIVFFKVPPKPVNAWVVCLQDLAAQSDVYDPAKDDVFNTREKVVERVRQYAPNNLTDGCWLTGIAQLSGPADEALSLLLHIYEDERGNGDPALNHCNIYRSVGTEPACSALARSCLHKGEGRC